ncbi:MAG TPA: 4-hydroxy-tetrahydrodipicolinate reductase [Bacteroidia bacterium]|nr:4-hydroxy-tetrahydrodipicolinate reductase [Bacteroidia bacterium]
MKIALLGYGKMGKTIEKIAVSRGHSIVLKVDQHNADPFPLEGLKKADVAIEFSTPKTVVGNILHCFRAEVPVVVGTTAWNDQMEFVAEKCKEHHGSIFTASNFSLGVNLFFRLNNQLAKMMNPYSDYDVSMEEIHHIHKLDSPSGTGITLADGIIANLDRKKNWKDYPDELPSEIPATELPIVSKRIGEVPGTHSVFYTSSVDKITITHEAFSREGFAAGAVIASEWLYGKKGIFGMNDLLGD